MKSPRGRSALLCMSLALLALPESNSLSQNQLGIIEVPVYYSGFKEDFERFSVWQRGGSGGKAEPVYDGVGGSRALLLKTDNGTNDEIEAYRLLNPYDNWQVSFHVKDLTESKEGSWLVGISEIPEKSPPGNLKRAYFAGVGDFDITTGVYSERDDDITPVPSSVKKDREFHSYSIRCAGSNIYFSVDGNAQGSVSGGFKSGKIFAYLDKGGHIILDNVAFEPQ